MNVVLGLASAASPLLAQQSRARPTGRRGFARGAGPLLVREKGLREVRSALESELPAVEHSPSEANGVACKDGFGEDDGERAARFATSSCGEVGGCELGYMSRIMKRGKMREVARI